MALALLASPAGAVLLSANHSVDTQKAKFTINDKISIDGVELASGDGIDKILGCNEHPKGTSNIEVCGCAVKVTANLLTECQKYGKYTTTVGHCDCGTTACDEGPPPTGYT